ncbi:CapA family protein [Streptomyces sp. NBC_00820]|uniref:CapA family protein n=1 Tax=Streptomyces sp. NBC_00820 TaxID=2975842 RepID=UPI002ED1EB5B|nr:CapA family protein [Streptomyces sp. NBC_00820]
MIGRRHQVALALTALLAAAAACQNQERKEPAATAHPAPPAARGFTLVASGDILPHTSVLERANYDAGGNGYDFRPMLAAVQPVVARADLALCHLETLSAQPALTPPPQLAWDLAAAGYDGCSTASDGSLDDGIRAALSAMDQAGLRHAGTARSEDEARTVTLLRAGPAKVAHLSYPYDTDENLMIADARAARRAGADVVVVSIRWGTSWQDAPDQRQLSLAQDLTASKTAGRPDVDLILGTHTHVPQAYEKVNGTWVVYGLGDQIAGETTNPGGARDSRGDESTVGRFTFAAPARPGGRWEVTRAEFLPQIYDVDAGRVVDLGRAIAGGAELTAARDRVRDVVLSRGAAESGLVAGR